MRVVLNLTGNLLRALGNMISGPRLTRRLLFTRFPTAVAFFTMLFVSIADGEVSAASGLPRRPVSFFVQGDAIHMVSNDQSPISYFADRLPDDADLPRAPDGATGIVVARVRLQEASVYLGGRDQSGEAPKSQPKDIFFTRIKIIDALRGDASLGQTLDVRFGQRGDKRRLIYPYTPDQRDREYVVVMYVDASDGRRRLAPFPITEFQYSQWEMEQSAYNRLRGKPGSRE